MQIDKIEWDCLKLIESVEVNAIEVQGIWDEEDEVLRNAVAVWGILPKGMTELKKRVIEDNVANITRSGKHYKPPFLEKDRPSRDIGEGSKPTEPKGKKREKGRRLSFDSIEENSSSCIGMGLAYGFSQAS